MRGAIEPGRLYGEHEVILEMGLSFNDLRRARARGLRCKELAKGRRAYLGSWLLDWLDAPAQRDEEVRA